MAMLRISHNVPAQSTKLRAADRFAPPTGNGGGDGGGDDDGGAFDFLRPAMADIIREYEATHGNDPPPPLDNSDSEHESEDGKKFACSDAADDLEPQL